MKVGESTVFPTVTVPLTPRVPIIVTGEVVDPISTLVEDAVPRLKVPDASTVAALLPISPELLTVKSAWAVNVKEPMKKSMASSR